MRTIAVSHGLGFDSFRTLKFGHSVPVESPSVAHSSHGSGENLAFLHVIAEVCIDLDYNAVGANTDAPGVIIGESDAAGRLQSLGGFSSFRRLQLDGSSGLFRRAENDIGLIAFGAAVCFGFGSFGGRVFCQQYVT